MTHDSVLRNVKRMKIDAKTPHTPLLSIVACIGLEGTQSHEDKYYFALEKFANRPLQNRVDLWWPSAR